MANGYRPCVGVMLLNAEGLVWIGHRRAGSPQLAQGRMWQMPQGGMDPGEDPEQAAFRELYEETSIRSAAVLDRTEDWLIYDFPPEILATRRARGFRGQRQKWFCMRFKGVESEINVLAPPDGHKAEFSAWRWEKAARLPDLIVPFKRSVYEAVLARFGKWTR